MSKGSNIFPAQNPAKGQSLFIARPRPTVLARDAAERMAASHPPCTLVEIAGAGHSVPMDRPAEFEQAVRGWLGV